MIRNESLNFGNVSLEHLRPVPGQECEPGQLLNGPNIVYGLGNGVIPKIAEAFRFELDEQANPDNMGELIRLVGPNAAMYKNAVLVEAALEDAVPTAAGWVEDSGIMTPVNHGLWKPSEQTPEDAVIVMTGAVPGWCARMVRRALEAPQKDVVVAVGSRVMNTPSDLASDLVQEFIEDKKREPKEFEFFKRFYKEDLEAKKKVTILESEEVGSTGILRDLFAEHPGLLDRKIAAVRVANAARMLALQIRLAATAVRPEFDSKEMPQMYAVSDEFLLAQDALEDKRRTEFQSPVTALRQVPVVAKELLSQFNEK